MKNLLKSKIAALAAFIVVIVIVIATFSLRVQWWCFIDIFFAFMAVFSHLAALLLGKFSPHAGKLLDKTAFWCLVLAVLSFVAEFVAWQIIF